MINLLFILLLDFALASANCMNSLRAIAHGIARDERGHVMRYVPFNGHGVIVDSNIITAIGKQDRQAGEASWVARLNHLARTSQKRNEGFHLWVTDTSVQETTGALKPTDKKLSAVDTGFPAGTKRLKNSYSVESDEYKSISGQLEQIGIGKTRGSDGEADQRILTDIFLADVRDGIAPTFVTADKGIIKPLCELNPECAKSLKKGTMMRDFKNGFTVKMKDSTGVQRTLNLIPFGN